MTKTLDELVAETGLAPDANIIGRVFEFSAEWDGHYETLRGQITSISDSDEGGLVLDVSTKRFWRDPLSNIRHNDDGWRVCTEDPHEGPLFCFSGTLKLL